MSLEERVKYAAMKARHKNTLRPWYKKWWGALLLALLALFLILFVACTIYVLNKIKEIRSGQDQADSEQQTALYLAAINGEGNGYALGTSTPQVTIVEFSDFACPFCQEAAPEIRAIAAAYPESVKLVYRDYPLHENSITLALAARCAGEQGKFWEMSDRLFSGQSDLSAAGDDLNARLTDLAASLKLDAAQFSACLSEQKYLSAVAQDFHDAKTLELNGTPTWFINNYRLTGYIPAEQFRALVDGLIK